MMFKLVAYMAVMAMTNPFCCCTAGLLAATHEAAAESACCEGADIPNESPAPDHAAGECPHLAADLQQQLPQKDALAAQAGPEFIPVLLAVMESREPCAGGSVLGDPSAFCGGAPPGRPAAFSELYCIYRI